MPSNTCRVCTGQIYLMCRKGTGICGELCEKREKNIQVDNLEAYKIEMETPFVFHEATVTPPVHPSEEIVGRPSVPSLLGWNIATKLENQNALMKGDIRRNADQTHDVWNGETWNPFDKVDPNLKVG